MGETILFGRKDSVFYVDIPHEIEDSNEDCELSEERIPESTTYFKEDHDYLEAQREVIEDVSDFAESMARSEEDGWFYDNTDGDWENNLVDPSSA